MVTKGNVDKHRYSYSRGVKAVETEKWGQDTAAKRYGEARNPNMRPPDQSKPQRLGDSDNLQGPGYRNEVANDWRRGFGKGGVESAEGAPNFDHSKPKR